MKSFREDGAEGAAKLESSCLCPSRYHYHVTAVSVDLLLTASAHAMLAVCVYASVCGKPFPLSKFVFSPI